MLSARGTLFNAAVQYNANKRYVEFLLGKNVRRWEWEFSEVIRFTERLLNVSLGIFIKSSMK